MMSLQVTYNTTESQKWRLWSQSPAAGPLELPEANKLAPDVAADSALAPYDGWIVQPETRLLSFLERMPQVINQESRGSRIRQESSSCGLCADVVVC